MKQEGLWKSCTKKSYRAGIPGKTGELGIGHCTRNFRHHLEGCPPVETEVYKFLKDYIENHQKFQKRYTGCSEIVGQPVIFCMLCTLYI